MTKLELLRERLRLYLQAEHDVLQSGQTVTIEGMTITRVNASVLGAKINELERAITAECMSMRRARRPRMRVVVPV